MNFKPPQLLFERIIPGDFPWDAFFMSRGSINPPGNVESTTQPEQHLGKEKMKFEHHKLQLWHIIYIFFVYIHIYVYVCVGETSRKATFFSKVYTEYNIS